MNPHQTKFHAFKNEERKKKHIYHTSNGSPCKICTTNNTTNTCKTHKHVNGCF